MKLPRIVDSRITASSRLFAVEELQLEFSNGNARVYERLKGGAVPGVMIVARNADNEILLIEEYAAVFHEYQLTLPKGAVDHGESVLQAANRELAEEVGFGARELTFVKNLTVAPGHMGFSLDVVFAQDLYEHQLLGDEPEPIRVVPWPVNQLSELIVSDQFNEGRAIAALMLCREKGLL